MSGTRVWLGNGGAHELVGKHENSFEREAAIAEVEEVLEAGAKEINHHDVIVTLLAVPADGGHTSCGAGDRRSAGIGRNKHACPDGIRPMALHSDWKQRRSRERTALHDAVELGLVEQLGVAGARVLHLDANLLAGLCVRACAPLAGEAEELIARGEQRGDVRTERTKIDVAKGPAPNLAPQHILVCYAQP